MKVFELMNELSCFPGGEEVCVAEGCVLLVAGGEGSIELPVAGVDIQPVRWASKAAKDRADAEGLVVADFQGVDGSGAGGTVTVADVLGLSALIDGALEEEDAELDAEAEDPPFDEANPDPAPGEEGIDIGDEEAEDAD